MGSGCFLEAAFIYDGAEPAEKMFWEDCSDSGYYKFRSAFGSVCLRKRSAYPATYAQVQGGVLVFGYGDMRRGQELASVPLAGVREEQFYDTEFLCVVADIGSQSVALQRDALSVLPVFAGRGRDMLVLSERFERVCELLAPDLRVDPVALASLLNALDTHGRTMCENISLVYDRMRIVWDRGAYRLLLPSDAAFAAQPKLESGAIRELRVRLDTTLQRYAQRYAYSIHACDLSGGKDSALIAGALRTFGYDPITLTMRLPGEIGRRQAEKIEAMRHHFSLKNISILLDDAVHAPLDFLRTEGERPSYHYGGSAYLGARDALLGEAARFGAVSAFAGYGGDELCEHIGDRRAYFNHDLTKPGPSPTGLHERFWGPYYRAYVQYAQRCAERAQPNHIPLLSAGTATAMAGNSYAYFEYNIWPAYPFADPALYAFCQRLPLRYRFSRNLTTMYLKARRFPPLLYNNTDEHLGEHFVHAFYRHCGGVARYYLEHSILAAHGIIDNHELLRAYDAASQNMHSNSTTLFTSMLFHLLQVEINLHALRFGRL